MSRRYSPNHPAVISSPHVMTPKQWGKLYRWPLALIGGGFTIAMLGWFMPPITLYGMPMVFLWCLPGGALCLVGFSRCASIYDLEREFDK